MEEGELSEEPPPTSTAPTSEEQAQPSSSVEDSSGQEPMESGTRATKGEPRKRQIEPIVWESSSSMERGEGERERGGGERERGREERERNVRPCLHTCRYSTSCT